jgi:predicted MFS family arabinose efflux permease
VGSSIAALTAALMVAVFYCDGPAPFPKRVFSTALVGSVLQQQEYRAVLGGYAGHMLELYACWIWLPSFITASLAAHGQDAATTERLASVLSFVVIAAGAIGCVIGGEYADRVGPVRLVVGAMALSGACALLTPLVFGQGIAWLIMLLLVWSITVIADSAQFSTLVTRVVSPDAVGTALTLQTSIGFLLTTVTIQTVPQIASLAGWKYAFPLLAIGPALGIAAIRQLRLQSVTPQSLRGR